MRPWTLSAVSLTSDLTKKASCPTPRWRLSWLKSRLEASYYQDVDAGTLPGQLSVLETILRISCFDDILSAVTKAPEPEKKLVQEVQTICKLLAANPTTNAVDERSFSSPWPLKTA